MKQDISTLPEFYHLFEHDEGPVTVSIVCTNNKSATARRRVYAKDIEKLVCRGTGGFIQCMTFDEWPIDIVRIEIKPDKSSIKITARFQE